MFSNGCYYIASLLIFIVGFTACNNDKKYGNNNSNYNVVRYEIEDLRGNAIEADLLKYKDETGIMESKYNFRENHYIWSYEAQFKKGKTYYLYYEEYVDPSQPRQEYRMSVYIDGQIVNDKYITIDPGASNHKEIQGTVENP